MKHLILLRAKVCPSIACLVTGVNLYVQLMDPRVMSSSMIIPLVLMLDMLGWVVPPRSAFIDLFVWPSPSIYQAKCMGWIQPMCLKADPIPAQSWFE